MEVRPGYKQTEVGAIPQDWDVGGLRDLVDSARTIRYGIVQPGNFDASGRYMIRGQDYSKGWVEPTELFKVSAAVEEPFVNARVKTGDVLITIVGASTGRIAIVPGWLDGANLTQTTARIATRPDRIDGTFCGYVLASPIGSRQVSNYLKGAAQPGLNCGDIEKFLVPLPPLPEQRAIAAALSDVDALLGGLERLIAKKRDLKQAAMQQLLTGQTRLPGFSGAWEVVEFGDIASIRNAKVVPSSTPPGTQCVELESIDQGTGRLLMSNEASGSASKYSFRAGDVLFGRLRSYLRKYWLATFDGICSTEIWPLIPRDGRLASSYLHLLVQTNPFVNAAGVSYGTHMPRSDWTVLTQLPVVLPPIPEQTAIAAVLSDMDWTPSSPRWKPAATRPATSSRR